MRAQHDAGVERTGSGRGPADIPASREPSSSTAWASLGADRLIRPVPADVRAAAVGGLRGGRALPPTNTSPGQRPISGSPRSPRRALFALGVGLLLFVPASLPTGSAPADVPSSSLLTAVHASGEGSTPNAVNVASTSAGLLERIEVIASADGIELATSSAATRMVGYHQAGSRRALALHPRGSPISNRNVGRYAAPSPTPGLDYAILWNRRRGTHPTSAADLAMVPDHPVPSPVSGTVARVRSYALYGRYPDLMVTIVPDGAPDRRVVVMHLDVTTVKAGDRVVAGHTPIAKRARRLPFPSQIDKLSGPGTLHVHTEIRVR